MAHPQKIRATHVSQWLRSTGYWRKPWLIMGDHQDVFRASEDLIGNNFCTLSLGHIYRHMETLVTHVSDTIGKGDSLEIQARLVLVPAQARGRHPTLDRLESQGRLLWYDMNSGGKPLPLETVVRLLSAGGVKKIRTLGIIGISKNIQAAVKEFGLDYAPLGTR